MPRGMMILGLLVLAGCASETALQAPAAQRCVPLPAWAPADQKDVAAEWSGLPVQVQTALRAYVVMRAADRACLDEK